MNRRELLTSAPLAVGGVLAGCSSSHFNPPPATTLDQSLLSRVQAQIVTTTAKFTLNSITQEDISAVVGSIQSLQGEFRRVNFDSYLKQAMAGVDSSTHVEVLESSLFSSIHNQILGAGGRISESDLFVAFDKIMPPSSSKSQIEYLQTNGVGASLSTTTDGLHSVSSPKPQENGDGSLCEYFNWLTGAIGTAAFALSLGCLTPPFFVMICPAIAVLGIIAALIGIADFWLC